MKRFYQDVFGWKPFKDEQGVVFFRLNGIVLGLFPNQELANDAQISAESRGFKRFSLSINFSSEAEVSKIFKRLAEKGATVLKEPEKVFWGGFSGYLQDPEGTLWELAYNPFMELDEEGSFVGEVAS